MRLTQLFTKTRKTPPPNETSVNARLLEQAGFVAKLMAGVYTFLPLGLRVLERVNRIIREEMNAVGGQELIMPALQPKEIWEPTGRWETLGPIMYQFKDHSDRWIGLGPTHEEVIATIAKQHLHSYRDLPLAVYQIQEKFRDEPRPKSGLIRGRQFLMKDLYSFHADQADLDHFYEEVGSTYERIFTRCGLTTMRIEASGGTFSKQFSHEFQVLSEAGEDRLIFCERGDFARNAEVAEGFNVGAACPRCGSALRAGKGIELGNIFKLGTTYSEAFSLTFLDRKGAKKPVIMASYGISPSRLVGAIVEVHHDEAGIRWPEAVAPYPLIIVRLEGDAATEADALSAACEKVGEVLYDDRDAAPGTKLKDADLLGIPWRAVVSRKTGKQVELKRRGSTEVQLVSPTKVVELLKESRHGL